MTDTIQPLPSSSFALTLPPDLLKPSSPARHTLLQHLRLLQLLHHRNKNQHRRSHWFRHFSNFRRALSKLCHVIGIDVLTGLSEEADAVSLDKKRNKGMKQPHAKNDKRIDLNKQQHRAVARRTGVAHLSHWTDSGLAVKWYTAFTTVTSTPSFAPLGLVLLAMLARIYTTIGITPHLQAKNDQEELQQQAREEEEIQAALAKFAQIDAINMWHGGSGSRETSATSYDSINDNDFGVIVSRDNAAASSTKAVPKHQGVSPAMSLNALEKSGQSRSASPALSATTYRPRPAFAQYESKIRSSPLALTPQVSSRAKMDANPLLSEGRGKKRKTEDFKAQGTTSAREPPKKKKKDKKPKNAIDALFAGL